MRSRGNILLIVLVAVGIVAASVGGYLWWSAKNSAPAKVVETKPVDEMANWKTYDDSKYNFQIKIPQTWVVEISSNSSGYVLAVKKDAQQLTEGNPPKLDITVVQDKSIDKYIADQSSSDAVKMGWAPKNIKNVTIAGYSGKQYNKSLAIGDEAFVVLFSKGNLLFIISTIQKDSTFDQILSTFKFLDQNGSSGIYGMATIGPTCPVQRQGEVCEKAYVGTVVIMKSGPIADPTSLEEFTRFQTDQNGNFRLNLPAGDYIALPYPKNAITFSKTQIHVEENRFSEVNILFDTGIR